MSDVLAAVVVVVVAVAVAVVVVAIQAVLPVYPQQGSLHTFLTANLHEVNAE